VFDPVRSYDKPGVIISQVANGIASTDSVRRVLFDPAALSPSERMSFSDKLKAQYGGNVVADLAIDVVTNPVVLMGALFAGGVGAANLAKGGRYFGGMGGVGAYVSAKFPILRSLHLTSGMTESMGQRKVQIARDRMHHQTRVSDRLGGMMQEPVENLLANVSRVHGVRVTSLDPTAAPNAAVAEELHKILDRLAVNRLAWDRDREETVVQGVVPARSYIRVSRDGDDPTSKPKKRTMQVENRMYAWLKKEMGDQASVLRLTTQENAGLLKRMPGLRDGENMLQSLAREKKQEIRVRLGIRPETAGTIREGGVEVKFNTKEKAQLVGDTAALAALDERYGLRGFMDAERKMYEQGKVFMVGDEAHYAQTGQFRVDRDKVLRLARSQMGTLEKGKFISENGRLLVGGEEAVRALLSDEVANDLIGAMDKSKGKRLKQGSSREEILDALVKAHERAFSDPYYMPRNTVEAYNAAGERIRYNPYTGTTENAPGPGSFQEYGFSPSPSGRGMMRTRQAQVFWAPEDLERIARNFGGTGAMDELIAFAHKRKQKQIEQDGTYRTMRIRPDIAADKYIRSVARDHAWFSDNVENNENFRVIMSDMGPRTFSDVKLPGPLGKSRTGGAYASTKDLGNIGEARRPVGGYSAWDLMEADLRASEAESGEDAYAADLWRKHIIPSMFGIKQQEAAAHSAAARMIRKGVENLADSRFMKAVEELGDYPARIIQNMRTWSKNPDSDAAMPWQTATQALYASHIGLNMGTVLLNLMHPIQSLHHLGFKESTKAYWQSMKMIGEYTAERAKLGMSAKPQEVNALREKIFSREFGGQRIDMTEIAGLNHSWDQIDKAGFGTSVQVGRPQFHFLELMMKPFQMSETLNRVMTAHSVFNAYENAGRTATSDIARARQDAGTAVDYFRFGTDPVNRPALFYTQIGRNPAFRQFAQYGIRSFTNVFTGPEMMGGTRTVAGMEKSGRGWRMLSDSMRMLAVSAVAYEIGKDALGMDFSRGLTFGPLELVGGSQPIGDQRNFPMYTPPILSTGWNAVRYLATGDQDVLKDLAPSLVPGGIAISRMLGTMPANETFQALGLQKTYADWSKSQGGMVPMFNGDGRYMGEYPTSDVVLRSFGMDMGRFNQPHELDQFLMKNRDAIRDSRRQFIAAVLGNNMSAAGQIKAGFEQRFKMPLTVTQQQFREAQKIREESVIKRTVNTIDQSMRGQYLQAVQQYLPGQLAQAPAQPVQQGAMYQWGQT